MGVCKHNSDEPLLCKWCEVERVARERDEALAWGETLRWALKFYSSAEARGFIIDDHDDHMCVFEGGDRSHDPFGKRARKALTTPKPEALARLRRKHYKECADIAGYLQTPDGRVIKKHIRAAADRLDEPSKPAKGE